MFIDNNSSLIQITEVKASKPHMKMRTTRMTPVPRVCSLMKVGMALDPATNATNIRQNQIQKRRRSIYIDFSNMHINYFDRIFVTERLSDAELLKLKKT